MKRDSFNMLGDYFEEKEKLDKKMARERKPKKKKGTMTLEESRRNFSQKHGKV